MKKTQLIAILLLCAVIVTGFINFKNSRDDKGAAYDWAFKACDTSSTQESANFAALANSLDDKWLRLSDAANALAGAKVLSETKSSWRYSSGNDAVGTALYLNTMYAQFVSECGLTFLVPKTD